MASLQPGQRVALGSIERLVLTMRGSAAQGCEIATAEPVAMVVRDMGRGRFAIDARPGSSQEIILQGRGQSPLTGSVIVEVRVIGGTGQTLDVTDIHLLGDASTPILQMDIDAGGDAELSSLVGSRAVVADDGGHQWVPQESVRTSAVCLIDRSASMAWVYLQHVLPSLLHGIADGCCEVMGDLEPELLTYGAPAEGSRWLQDAHPAPGVDRFHLQPPELFSSGARVPEAALAERDDDFTVVVTDAPHPVMGLRGNVGFVLPVSEDAAGLTQDMQDKVTACHSAGQPVLVLRVQSGDKVRAAAAQWSADRLRSGLMRRRESR